LSALLDGLGAGRPLDVSVYPAQIRMSCVGYVRPPADRAEGTSQTVRVDRAAKGRVPWSVADAGWAGRCQRGEKDPVCWTSLDSVPYFTRSRSRRQVERRRSEVVSRQVVEIPLHHPRFSRDLSE
jgi:hypothetical protein